MPDQNNNITTAFVPELWAQAMGVSTQAPMFYDQLNAVGAISPKTKAAHSTSQRTDTLQTLIDHLAESEESINRELAELDSVRSLLENQVEVLAEIGSRVRSHISNLRRVANQHGKSSLKQHPAYQLESEPELSEAQQTPAEAVQIAATEGAQAWLEPVEQDQG